MATKNIPISEDAYRRLASLKREHESYSIVITRLTGKRALADLIGVFTRKEAIRIERNFKTVKVKRREADQIRQQRLQEAFA